MAPTTHDQRMRMAMTLMNAQCAQSQHKLTNLIADLANRTVGTPEFITSLRAAKREIDSVSILNKASRGIPNTQYRCNVPMCNTPDTPYKIALCQWQTHLDGVLAPMAPEADYRAFFTTGAGNWPSFKRTTQYPPTQ